MVNIIKISHQIIDDGLYNTILYEMKEESLKEDITPQIVQNLLKTNPSYIRDYKEINRHSELSSIQVKKIAIKDEDKDYAKQIKNNINENIQILKNLENFEVDSKNSAYSIWIGSAGVMVIFMIHNVIALFTELYTTDTLMVYLLFIIILVLTYLGYIKIKNHHDTQHVVYTNVYDTTKKMLDNGFNSLMFTYDEIYE